MCSICLEMEDQNGNNPTVRQSAKAWIVASPTVLYVVKMLLFGLVVILLFGVLCLLDVVGFKAFRYTSISVLIAETAIFGILFLSTIGGILARHGVFQFLGFKRLPYSIASVTENRKAEQKALHDILTGRGGIQEDVYASESVVLTEVKKAENQEVLVELIGRDGKDVMFKTNHYPTPVSFVKISNKYSALKSDTQKPNASEKAIESFVSFEPYYLKAVALKAELEEKERSELIDKKKPVRMLFRPYIQDKPIQVKGMYDDCNKYVNDYLLHEQNPSLPKPNNKKLKVEDWGWQDSLEVNRIKKGSIYFIENC